jgi:catechol-2,3-dioxygenase
MMVRVSGLYRLGLRVPDLETVSDFYRDNWAMTVTGSDFSRRYFHSRGVAHADLMLQRGDSAALDHVAFSVASESDLQVLINTLERAGHAVRGPVQAAHPGEGLSVAVSDPDGNRLELVVPSSIPSYKERHLGHVVLWTPRMSEQEAFYTLLGFQVSDRTQMGMSFLRCNADHHSIALARSARGRTGLQHVAFDVGSIDEVMREFGRLRSQGIECIWGVGRHGPGNNVFSYYRDPAGNVVEYYGDMERVNPDETVEPRFWGPEHKGDLWGIAGAPPMPMRD